MTITGGRKTGGGGGRGGGIGLDIFESSTTGLIRQSLIGTGGGTSFGGINGGVAAISLGVTGLLQVRSLSATG